MSFTVEDLDKKIGELIEAHKDTKEQWAYGYDAITELDNSFSRNYGNNPREDETIELEGFGTLSFVEHYGGEGQGDEYWTVFKVADRYFRINGWYSSYEGGEYDGALEEVFPEQVTRTEYFSTKEKAAREKAAQK